MKYQKPDLFLVGAAQGLVLGASRNNPADHADPLVSESNCDFDNTSRNSGVGCP